MDRDRALPLSFAQQRLWLLDQLNPSVAHHVTAGLQLRGLLDRQALRAALDRIIARHEVLRTVFRNVDGEPEQMIQSVDSVFALTEQEVTEDSGVEQISQQEAREPFDLSTGPLIRGRLLRVSDREHVLLITQHLIISDQWSIGVLLREMSALYCAFIQGKADPLPPLELQYADYASWQRQQVSAAVLDNQLEFWKQNLSGTPEFMQLPTDRPRQMVQRYSADRVQLRLSEELTERLRGLARQQGVTLFVTLLSGWAMLLGRWSGQEEVIIVTPVPNRRGPETEPLIGSFENMTVLRVRLQSESTIEQLLRRTQTTVVEACAHQDVLFEQMVEALKPIRNHGPVFQVLMGLNDVPVAIIGSAEPQLPGLEFSEASIENAKTQLELSLSLVDRGNGLTGRLEYASDLFERETIERLAADWEVLLEAIVTDTQKPISQLPILSRAHYEQVLYGFNDTTVEYPRDCLIHELFEEQVQLTPDAIAVAYERQSMTYAELNGRANKVARHLIDKGVGPDQLVGVCVERSLEMVVGLLGTLKAGGGYVPLDPNYPTERLQYILGDAAPKVLLTQERLKERLPSTTAEVIALDNDWGEIDQQPSSNVTARTLGLRSDNLAYVIYTSGSTGRPKGVVIEHRNTVNLIFWARSAMAPEVFSQTLHSTSLNFDLSVYECFVPLTTGGSIQVVENALALVKSSLGVTLINSVPSAIKGILDSGSLPETTRIVNLAGEALKRELVDRIFARSSVERVSNLYGPSETTTYSTWVSMSRDDGFIASIGRPVANTKIYILDRCCQIVPIGVVGEIYVGGAGVARGYLNRPELTMERFLPDPFSLDAKARLYKTGDLGRWRSDGTIEYLGRNDYQVKIRGYRIELGEIEAQLERHAQVKEAAVVAHEDTSGEKRLVAYIRQRDFGDLNLEEVRAHLKTALPEYMVPSAFVTLESLPLTPNGKLDRRALPAPQFETHASQEYEAPQGEVEEILAGMWQELLQVKRVGRQDHFFNLGGDSLSAMRLVVRLTERFAIQLHALAVFRNPSFRKMAQFVEKLLWDRGQVGC